MLLLNDTGYMSGTEFVGSVIFFFIFLPSLVVMGIWFVVRDIRWNQEWERGCDSFAQDFLTPSPLLDDTRARLRQAQNNR